MIIPFVPQAKRFHAPADRMIREGRKIRAPVRVDLNYLLLNVFDPSGDIPDAYKMVTITTENGQVLAGTVTEEDANKVVLSMIGQKSTIAKRDIEKRDVSEFSMMPEGQMQTLTDEQVLDLFKYLQTKQQVDLPE